MFFKKPVEIFFGIFDHALAHVCTINGVAHE